MASSNLQKDQNEEDFSPNLEKYLPFFVIHNNLYNLFYILLMHTMASHNSC